MSKLGGIIGIGLAYAGSAREDFIELLTDNIINTQINVEISAFSALSLSLIFVGTCNDDIAMSILQTLMERPENQMSLTVARYFGVALGILFLGKGEASEAAVEILNSMENSRSSFSFIQKVISSKSSRLAHMQALEMF